MTKVKEIRKETGIETETETGIEEIGETEIEIGQEIEIETETEKDKDKEIEIGILDMAEKVDKVIVVKKKEIGMKEMKEA